MRLYDCTADCLVDYCLLHYFVIAKNEKEAWLKGYTHFIKSSVADSGSVDVKRVTNFHKLDNIKIHR